MADGPWDVGHTEDGERIGELDYLDDAGEGPFMELVSNEEEVLARRGSVLDIKASYGQKAQLIGKYKKNREDSFKRLESANSHFHNVRGLTYNAILFRDGFANPSFKDGRPKSRRPVPQAIASDFLDRISFDGGKWIYEGMLNDWPGLSNLEVVSMQYIYKNKLGVYAKQYWESSDDPKSPPFFPEAGMLFFLKTPDAVRVVLRAPSWTEDGYTRDNPGLVYWYSAFDHDQPRFAHGHHIIGALRDTFPVHEQPKATHAHFFAHRYARRKKESAKDRITYHTGIFLEWDHGAHGTVLELAFLNGLGGYAGRSNWLEDRDKQPMNDLFYAMPASMVLPWTVDRAELRMIDVEAKTVNEFVQYLEKHRGKRFVEPEIVSSSPVRVTFREKEHIAKYLLNYSIRDTSYSEIFRNCQTFAADMMSFLAGKQKFEPYHPLNRIMYIERKHLFMYDPDQFEKTKTSMASWAGMKQWFQENYGSPANEERNIKRQDTEFSLYDTLKETVSGIFNRGKDSSGPSQHFTLEDSDDGEDDEE